MKKKLIEQKLIGWREWVALPALGIPRIKTKIDTGARTSSLHAFSLNLFQENGKQKIRFEMHPFQKNQEIIVSCVADIIDKRPITDSGGHREERYVICTPLAIGGEIWPIEITLTERDNMLFRMLLGRRAIRRKFIINPAKSFLIR
jgi:hypothetical protein